MKLRNTIFMLIIIMALASCGKNTVLEPDDTDPTDISFGTDTTLDIVTWNLKMFPENTHIDNLRQMILALNADVIAFQEIMDATAFANLAHSLTGYDAFIYTDTAEYRLAYLVNRSRVNVYEDYTIYENDSNPFPRAPYILKINWQDEDYYIINNHLKAYGDNNIDPTDEWDEERRRLLACQMLDEYISTELPNEKVVVLGDMNDQINEPASYNVFQTFLDKPQDYLFADLPIAMNINNNNASYPSSNSHIDHIMITNELFHDFAQAGDYCRTIKAENWLGGWSLYAETISDHRPVGIRLGN